MRKLNKIKLKYVIIILINIILFFAILPTYMRYKSNVTASAVGYVKETRSSTYKVKFDSNGGTGSMSDMTVGYNVTQSLTPNAFSYAGHFFAGWNTEANGSGIAYSNGQDIIQTTYVTGNEINLYAQWVSGIAETNGVYYNTLQLAVDAVPNNVQTTVTLYANTSEQITVSNNKDIIFNFQNNTITNSGSLNSIIENSGTIRISNGTLRSTGSPAVINNNSGGTLIMTGGTIIATSSNKGQAIYNNGGNVEISGTAYLSSASTNRATVHHLSTGTLKITGGTIISNKYTAVLNDKSSNPVEIGTKDGTISTVTPIIQGAIYGVDRNSSASFKFYDGIIKGKTLSINNENSLIVDKETGYEIAKSEETINSEVYRTAYLADANDVGFAPCAWPALLL